MRIEPESPALYYLRVGSEEMPLNEVVGHPLHIRFTGQIFCVVCGRKTAKAFGQGFCFPCFRDSPENAPCILHPELCRGHLGEGRDVAWEKENHVQPHIVYLAWSSGLKVGVTRETQIPVRWLDQGAILARPVARTPYRYLAGLLEVAFKSHIADKTDWRRMLLTTEPLTKDPLQLDVRSWTPDDLKDYLLDSMPTYKFTYPWTPNFSRLVPLDLKKISIAEGRLLGMKGQYLAFSDGRVLNVRNHSGYEVEVHYG
ncbi:MAG: DUF2797 domain-containing protein [Flavobacteriales bacterium]|nr:DUF2797 domain-containing protein [Flavobacteriales bacterium]MDW8432256.1 DUF2797 domain-containing protein [Flavobacteriales bacterium]